MRGVGGVVCSQWSAHCSTVCMFVVYICVCVCVCVCGSGDQDECIEWQVNYGYQKCHEFLIQIQNKHLKLTISLSSIPDQKAIFIPISHVAKSHTHKSIFGSTQTKNQFIQCICCQFNY